MVNTRDEAGNAEEEREEEEEEVNEITRTFTIFRSFVSFSFRFFLLFVSLVIFSFFFSRKNSEKQSLNSRRSQSLMTRMHEGEGRFELVEADLLTQ